jgi:hypothetical protein
MLRQTGRDTCLPKNTRGGEPSQIHRNLQQGGGNANLETRSGRGVVFVPAASHERAMADAFPEGSYLLKAHSLADLTDQMPTKYESTPQSTWKSAKSLGLTVPPGLLVAAARRRD